MSAKLENRWLKDIKKHLLGKKITAIEYISEAEAHNSDWYKRPIAIQLDNKDWIIPMMDDEGNDGGAMSTTFKDLPTIPVL